MSDYPVGYGKPPEHSRFRKGQSGNPRGRPRGAKGLKTIMREVLTEKVTVKTATGTKRVMKIEAAAHKMMERAFTGDMRALNAIAHFYSAAVPDEPIVRPASEAGPQTREEVDAHDRAMLDELITMMRDQGEEQ